MSFPKDAIYDILSPLIGATTIWRDINAPRPSKPYATLAFGNTNPTESVSRRPLTEDGHQDVIKTVTTVIEIAYYGDEAYMRLLDTSTRLGFTTTVDRCVGLNVSVGRLLSLNNVPMAVDKLQYEERAVMEIEFNWLSILTDEPGRIEQVVIGGSDTGGAMGPMESCIGVVTSP
jgi:hypothetical protein